MRTCKPVLLVEDDTIDAMTVQRAFKDLTVVNALAHALEHAESRRVGDYDFGPLKAKLPNGARSSWVNAR